MLPAGGEIASTFDTPEAVKLGRCKVIEEIMIGEDKLVHFSGVALGEACTIVLRGASALAPIPGSCRDTRGLSKRWLVLYTVTVLHRASAQDRTLVGVLSQESMTGARPWCTTREGIQDCAAGDRLPGNTLSAPTWPVSAAHGEGCMLSDGCSIDVPAHCLHRSLHTNATRHCAATRAAHLHLWGIWLPQPHVLSAPGSLVMDKAERLLHNVHQPYTPPP